MARCTNAEEENKWVDVNGVRHVGGWEWIFFAHTFQIYVNAFLCHCAAFLHFAQHFIIILLQFFALLSTCVRAQQPRAWIYRGLFILSSLHVNASLGGWWCTLVLVYLKWKIVCTMQQWFIVTVHSEIYRLFRMWKKERNFRVKESFCSFNLTIFSHYLNLIFRFRKKKLL